MPLLSITRLRIRSIWFLPKFFLYTVRAVNQAKSSAGILNAKTLNDANMTFWTVLLWTDETSMRKYMTSGSHKKAMPYLQRWCDEARTGNIIIEGTTFPSADDLHKIIITQGHASKVQKPNTNHLNSIIPKPTFKI